MASTVLGKRAMGGLGGGGESKEEEYVFVNNNPGSFFSDLLVSVAP
jgi:hypothetical protein